MRAVTYIADVGGNSTWVIFTTFVRLGGTVYIFFKHDRLETESTNDYEYGKMEKWAIKLEDFDEDGKYVFQYSPILNRIALWFELSYDPYRDSVNIEYVQNDQLGTVYVNPSEKAYLLKDINNTDQIVDMNINSFVTADDANTLAGLGYTPTTNGGGKAFLPDNSRTTSIY